MAVIKIDVIRLQTPQAQLDGLHHLISRRTPAVGAGLLRKIEFGRHYDAMETSFECMTQRFFGSAVIVDVGRVDEIYSGVEGCINNLVDLRLWHIRRAETIGAEPDDRNPDPRDRKSTRLNSSHVEI